MCPYCGHDFRAVMAPQQTQTKDSSMPFAGGILIILGSLIYLAVGMGMVTGGAIWSVVDDGDGGFVVAMGLIVLVLGVVSVLGGIFSIQKKNFVWALLSGILTIPTVLGLIGLILVAVSKDDFSS